MADTGKWLLDQDSFQDWYWDGRSSSFWLHGLMGSGKSCLSHVVIDKLMSVIDMKNGEQLAYYYIDGNEDRENDDYTTNILRCLLKQLADPGFEGKVMEAVFDAYKNHVEKSHLTEDESVELIRAIVDGNNTTFLVIDGLDECDAPAQESLMYHLSELFTDTKGLLKVFFTSRPGSHIKDLMEPFQPKMIDAVKYNSGDIDKLVKTRVRDSVAMPDLRLLYKRGKEDQSAQVERILRKNAQGMFRWVEMAFSHLHKSKNFGIMQRRLEELPRLQNLFDLYDQVYDSTIQDLDPVDRAALRMTMTLMLYIDKTFLQTVRPAEASNVLKPSCPDHCSGNVRLASQRLVPSVRGGRDFGSMLKLHRIRERPIFQEISICPLFCEGVVAGEARGRV